MKEALFSCRQPYLIGVRHHSPACAVRMPEWLEAFSPELLLLELPPEFSDWLDWLSHPETIAPVALAGADDKERLFFYPFADFSPELAALRWAREHRVPVVAFDLPAGITVAKARVAFPEGEADRMQQLQKALGSDDFEAFWAEHVEAKAPSATAEALRCAALFAGWVQRLEEASEGLLVRDLARETAMRTKLFEYRQKRVACVVGAFHAAALLPEPELWREQPVEAEPTALRTSLVPYSFDLLDSRSGYPAGIRDPLWQQEIWQSGLRPEAIREAVSRLAVKTCRALRTAKHPAGSPDASETVRMSLQLAELRGLPAPGRQEFLEAVQSCMAQGELLGRGRALAKALEEVLVGRRRGKLAPGTPQSGLLPHVRALREELKLTDGPELVRLDPLSSPLDRRRHVALRRLQACAVPYGELRGAGQDTLTQVWHLHWTPASEAMVELAGLRGVTLQQAAFGAISSSERPLVERAVAAAESGLLELTESLLAEIGTTFLESAGLSELLAAFSLLQRLQKGHIPGLEASELSRLDTTFLVEASVRAVDGLLGSEQPEDALALAELLRLEQVPGLRLRWSLQQMRRHGSALMQGASLIGLYALAPLSELPRANAMLGSAEHEVAPTLSSWLQGPPGKELSARLQGVLALGAGLLEADPSLRRVLERSIGQLSDREFLERVASLRRGFEVLSPADRSRFLDALGLSDRALPLPASKLADLALADREGRAAVLALGLELPESRYNDTSTAAALRAHELDEQPAVNGEIGLSDRFRLILGRSGATNPLARRAARALEELYGHGRGEGSLGLAGGGGGDEESFPSTLEWAEELQELFGTPVRQEVLAQAGADGRAAALLALDPQTVIPSVDLLRQTLSLVGAVPEQQIATLRPLVSRVVEQLTKQLATEVRPALQGLESPRATRRPGGRLDLRRTVAANLHTARPEPWRIAPEKLFFRSRQKRSLDWRLVLVVDVSGSMETSIIYSAIMASILASVPALSVHFVAFSTKVIDFSERVADPLALLMEVRVGGGTDIAPALRYARGLLSVPSRSLVVLVSDFEDFGTLPGLTAEVRALAESGARPLGLAALSDEGKPRFCQATASALVAAGMPIAALTPLELARWVGDQLRS